MIQFQTQQSELSQQRTWTGCAEMKQNTNQTLAKQNRVKTMVNGQVGLRVIKYAVATLPDKEFVNQARYVIQST